MSRTTSTGCLHPSWAIFQPRPAPMPGSNEPSAKEIGLLNSCSTSGQQAPNHAVLPSSSTGMMRLASKVITCSGRPATPPLSLMYFSYTSAAPGMFGYGGNWVLTGAVTITLIGSPVGAPALEPGVAPAAVVAAPPAVVAAPAAVVAAPPAVVA